jgi:hypothetical protein
MDQYFELASLALQLDPEGVRSGNEERQLSALEAANAFLLQAKKVREAWEAREGRLDQGRFLEAVERGWARDELERSAALKGEPSALFVRVPSEEFDEILRAEGACPGLLRKKAKAHLNRFEQLRYKFDPLEGGEEKFGGERGRNFRPIKGAIILKELARQYARSESERMRGEDAARHRARRR